AHRAVRNMGRDLLRVGESGKPYYHLPEGRCPALKLHRRGRYAQPLPLVPHRTDRPTDLPSYHVVRCGPQERLLPCRPVPPAPCVEELEVRPGCSPPSLSAKALTLLLGEAAIPEGFSPALGSSSYQQPASGRTSPRDAERLPPANNRRVAHAPPVADGGG